MKGSVVIYVFCKFVKLVEIYVGELMDGGD